MGTDWEHFGDRLGAFWGHLGSIFSVLGTLREHFDPTASFGDRLGAFWGQIGSILGTLREHLGTDWEHFYPAGTLRELFLSPKLLNYVTL